MTKIKICLKKRIDIHEDIVISSPHFADDLIGDSYYFFIGLNEEQKPNFREEFKQFLLLKAQEIINLQPTKELFIPLLLFDEYCSFMVVRKYNLSGFCNVYFFSTEEMSGFMFNPWNDFTTALNKNRAFQFIGGYNCNQEEIAADLRNSANKMA